MRLRGVIVGPTGKRWVDCYGPDAGLRSFPVGSVFVLCGACTTRHDTGRSIPATCEDCMVEVR
jgi:hypothetical protein